METDEKHLVCVKVNRFPSNLWHLVNNPQISSVSWDLSGQGVLIHEKLFEVELLFFPYMETNRNFASFSRQLYLYGFRKVPQSPYIPKKRLSCSFVKVYLHHFYNPNFIRTKPELLTNLMPLTVMNRNKLSAGMELSRKSSSQFSYHLPKSLQTNSAVLEKDSVIVEQQEPPHSSPCNGSEQVKACNRSPEATQAFTMSHGDPGAVFHHHPMDSKCVHPTSSVHMQKCSPSAVPDGNLFASYLHHSQYSLYVPGYQCSSSRSLDSAMACSQKPATSFAHRGYYADYSIGFQSTGQNPNWQPGDARDCMERDMTLETTRQYSGCSFLFPMKSSSVMTGEKST